MYCFAHLCLICQVVAQVAHAAVLHQQVHGVVLRVRAHAQHADNVEVPRHLHSRALLLKLTRLLARLVVQHLHPQKLHIQSREATTLEVKLASFCINIGEKRL